MSTIFGVDRRKLSGFDFSEAEWRGTRGSERKLARFRRRSAAAGHRICTFIMYKSALQFQATENATQTQYTTLKTYGKLSLFIFLTLYH